MRIYKGSIGGTGGGTIGGMISVTQVAFGAGPNTINGSSDFTWDNGLKVLKINGSLPDILIQNSGPADAAIFFGDGQNAAVSPANQAKLRYNNFTETMQISINTGGWVDLGDVPTDLPAATALTASGATAYAVTDSTGIDFNIPLSGSDATPHFWAFGVGNIDILFIQGSGNGAGSTTNANVVIDGYLQIQGDCKSESLHVDDGGSNDAFIDSAAGQSAGISGANHGRLRYNNTTHAWQGSVNGGAYFNFLTPSNVDLVMATANTASGSTAAMSSNNAGVFFNIPTSGVDATLHQWAFGAHGTKIFTVEATGNGAGGITNPSIYFRGTLKTDAGGPALPGSDFTFVSGDGGAATVPLPGGTGGGLLLVSGKGGNASATEIGGNGGQFDAEAGPGGDGTAAQASGDGGNVVLSAGAPGADNGGGSGVYGFVEIFSNTTSILIRDSGFSFELPDNAASALLAEDQSTNHYLVISTATGTESIAFGNASTNPKYSFLGSGLFEVSGPAQFDDRIRGVSASISAANNLVLGAANVNIISGSTTINAITTSGWNSGAEVALIFTGSPTVKNNTAGGAGTAKILLDGSVDLAAAPNTVLGLVFDGTVWQQTFLKAA